MRVHVVVPARFDDPTNPSGGNIYDQRICTGLTNLGWDVRITPVAVPRPLTTPPTTRPATDTRPATTATDTRPATTATGTRPATTADGMRPATTADGTRPATAEAARADLSRALTAIPDGELVLIDGLIASPSADPLLSHAPRLRLAVLVHTPHAPTPTTTPAHQSERAVLTAAAAVIATSTWTRHQLETHYAIPPTRIHVAHPGTDLPKAPHPNATPPINGHLLCVAALAPHKAQDLLIRALANLPDLPWDCTLVGPLDRDPDFVTRLRTAITQAALTPRVHLTGPLTAEPLNRAYAAADLLVVPSRADTYGMVVTEALAHALPVLTTTAGGLPEALGHTPHGTRPGHLIPPEDPKALTAALEKWLTNAPHRTHLRKAAADRRPTLPTWPQTTQAVATALTAAARDVTR